jgi:DNA-directed RNA polymerase subunit RPC12/RpoP
MRIIKIGKVPVDKEYDRTCIKCLTQFVYSENDVKTDTRNESYVECPICKSFITHLSEKKPAEAYYNK